MEVQIAGVPHISFSSDLWSTTVSVNSLISLTAHWLTESFDKKHAVLHALAVDSSHTSEQIRKNFEEMFNKWGSKDYQIL